MLSPTEKKMLNLLSYEICGVEISAGVSKVNWDEVLYEAKRHVVVPLLYPGLKNRQNTPAAILSEVRRSAIYSADKFNRILKAQQEIEEVLSKHNITFSIMKGTSIACIYSHPELRIPGDIDLLIENKELITVKSLLEHEGFSQTHKTERHWCFQKSSVEVEIHPAVSLFPNTEKGNFAKWFTQDALNHIEFRQINGLTFPVLSGVYQLISLLTHMEHHLVTTGIGLRQLCDWAVAINAQRAAISTEDLNLLDQCGLLYFAKTITAICEKYLALEPFEWCQDASPDLVDVLMRDILDGGNFQTQGEIRPFGGIVTDAYNVTGNVKSSLLGKYFSYIQRRIQFERPWAKSKAWIVFWGLFYPVRWIIRVLLGKREKVSISLAIRSANKREKILRKLELYK